MQSDYQTIVDKHFDRVKIIKDLEDDAENDKLKNTGNSSQVT